LIIIGEVFGAIRFRLVDRKSRFAPAGNKVDASVLLVPVDVLLEVSAAAREVWAYPPRGAYVIVMNTDATTAKKPRRRGEV